MILNFFNYSSFQNTVIFASICDDVSNRGREAALSRGVFDSGNAVLDD